MTQFFRRIVLSCVSPSSFKELSTKSFWRGFWYLYFLLTLLSVFPVLHHLSFTKTAHDWAVSFAESLKENAKTLYPPELELTFENGEVRSNVAEPFFIELPEQLKRLLDEDNSADKSSEHVVKHLVAIDTAGRAEDFYDYESLLLLTRRNVIVPDKHGTFKIHPIPADKDLIVNKYVYNSFINGVLPYADKIPTIVDVAVPVMMFSYPLVVPSVDICFKLLYLLFPSLIVLVVAKLMKRDITFGRIYILSMYGITLPLIVCELFGAFSRAPTFLFTALLLLWMLLILTKIPKASSHKPVA